MTIIEAMADEQLFKPLFRTPETWRPWRAYLKSLFGLRMTEEELEVFHSCTGREVPPSGQSREAFCIAGRRSGKSFISALIAVFLACLRDWGPFLGPGECPNIFVIANDKAQAGIVRHYVGGILNSVPALRALVQDDLKESVLLRNGIRVMVKTSSFRSLRGYTVLAAVLEEVAFWRSEEGAANPDKEILAALRPALATVPGSLLLGISTPYARQGVLWEAFKSHFAKNEPGAPLIWRASTRTMNPTIPIETIDQALAADREAGLSEWQAEFRSDIESFLGLDVVERLVVPGRAELPPVLGVRYTGFLDPSGGRSDSFTLAICHLEKDGPVILDCIRERRPPFSPAQVVQEFAEVLKIYNILEVQSDRYGGEWPVQEFAKAGVKVKAAELSASEFYLAALPLFTSGAVELLESKRLTGQLVNLERRVRSGGRDFITHYPGGHDDISNAVTGALVLASRARALRPGRVSFSGQPEKPKPPGPPPVRMGTGGRLGKVSVSEGSPEPKKAKDMSPEEFRQRRKARLNEDIEDDGWPVKKI